MCTGCGQEVGIFSEMALSLQTSPGGQHWHQIDVTCAAPTIWKRLQWRRKRGRIVATKRIIYSICSLKVWSLYNSPLLPPYPSLFLIAMTKSHRNNFREEGFIWPHCFRQLQVHCGWEGKVFSPLSYSGNELQQPLRSLWSRKQRGRTKPGPAFNLHRPAPQCPTSAIQAHLLQDSYQPPQNRTSNQSTSTQNSSL